jgi:site-specific DNA-methyltransferase (adenine-specific)
MKPFFENKTKTAKLYHGDVLDVLKRFEDKKFDLIFSDPPYNLSNDGLTCKSGAFVSVNKGDWDRSNGFEQDLKFFEAWIKECKRVLKDDGTLWISGTYHSIFLCGYTLQKQGWHILNDISWFKPNASPNLSCRMFTASHETLIWAKKTKKSKHQFNYDYLKNEEWDEDFFKSPNKQMRSVWRIPTPKKQEKAYGKHPTQKPLALLERVIHASSKEKDLILDPFCGSGTTGVAALKHNRKFVGIDKSLEYLENIAIKRIQELKL